MLNVGIMVFMGLGIMFGVLSLLFSVQSSSTPDSIACTMDAMVCSDGSSVGRSGPDCTFMCPPLPDVPTDVQESIDTVADRIVLTTPAPMATIMSPLMITGEARGGWFFEGTFPITLTNWDGLIIAEGFASADGEWMTEDFVPFSATLEFVSPFVAESPDFMQRGTLILKRNNASGLPEHDAALEVPVRFAP
jgi:hypothetical protein